MQREVFGRGLHPETNEMVVFRLDDTFQEVLEKGPGYRLGNLRCAAEAIANPERRFVGLKREGMEAAYAYITRPSRRYVSATDYTPAPPDAFFATYFDRGMSVFEAIWVFPGLQFPHLPADEAAREFLRHNFDREITP